ncbi:helix-turn-helix transcriptional regulator [Lactobacillus sp.]|uniref:helix-turn-helix domain-containing protein n=1 Tax=Lactobacillus sp. TaxID=1591 RepID=UPI00198BDDA2|nr:helix-turn-helix transcriptional regulator [Lactobacillus sp.]MBD5429518.1 helix-turn-helix transcriptional regulator [Lactobacillus sp.]
MVTISTLLNDKDISLAQVAQESGIKEDTLKAALNEIPDLWTVRVLKAFASTLEIKPGELLELVAPNVYQLQIEDDTQTIQGIVIPNLEIYQQIRFIIEAEHLEGWNPSPAEVNFLLTEALDPNPDLQVEIDDIWGEMHG